VKVLKTADSVNNYVAEQAKVSYPQKQNN